MSGKSSSSANTTQSAYDNRSFTEINEDNRVYNTVDDRDDNRRFYDNRQDNSVTNINQNDNRKYTTIDDRDDNRVFEDNRQDNSVTDSYNTINNTDNSQTFGDGTVVNQGDGTITITETDHGAVDQAIDFAGNAVGAVFGAFGDIVENQQASNAAFMDAVLKNSAGGTEDSNRHMVYAALFAGVAVAGLVVFRKGF